MATTHDAHLPAYSVEAEQALLGCLLLDNTLVSRIGDLAEDDFYRDDHRRIFRHLSRLIEHQELADVVTVADSLERDQESDRCGGLAYLGKIAEAVPSLAALPSYVRIVRDAAIKRQLAAAWHESANKAGNGIDIDELVTLTNDHIATIRSRRGPKRNHNPPLDWKALATQEPPQHAWLIDGWLGRRQPTLLAGPGGSGKSLLAQQIASCLTLALPFFHAPAPAPLRVLIWACEDDAEELWRRQAAISRWLERPLKDFDRLTVVPRTGLDNTLLTTEYGRPIWTPLLNTLREQCADLDADLVIIDNIGQTFGGNENERHAVTHFVNGVCGACNKATPLFVGHPSKALGSEFSGSTAWENAMRMRWWFASKPPEDTTGAKDEEDEDSDIRFLCKRKTNYSSKDHIALRYESGVFTVSQQDQADDALAELQAERVVLNAITTLAAMNIHASERPSSSYLPALILRYGLAEGLKSRRLARTMDRLIGQGRIRREVVGRDNARRPRFGLVCK